MPKRLITTAAIALTLVAAPACADHRNTPLAPPTPATSVPVLGGGQVPEVIEVPTATSIPTTTKSR